MSKIVIELNKKSVENAIKKLNEVEKKLKDGVMISDFLAGVCEWLIFRASTYVKDSDIGENVKSDINAGWSYVVSGKNAKITNNSDKAVFVEFGVGSMGEQIPHDNAEQTEYQYNVNNRHYWVYNVDSVEDVDMHKGYIAKPRKDGSIWIITKGSWRVMYAYQAIVDAKVDLMNQNGQIAQIWKTVKSRYI
jgi:hypothetical protein